MTDRRAEFPHTGIYTVPEAARLTKVSKDRIRRWIKGYDFLKGGSRRHSEPVWHGEIKPLEAGGVALGFLDLVEVRFVNAFLKHGVSWATMRKAHVLGRRELETEHPFCSNRFVTDTRRILLRHANEPSDQALIDLVSNQREFRRIIEPFLKELEFTDDELSRWWPLGKARSVVVDPSRNFGQPTAVKSGVPTQVLARCVKANDSVEAVARWYEVAQEEVSDAVDFEQSLAA